MPRSRSPRSMYLVAAWMLFSAVCYISEAQVSLDKAASQQTRCKLTPELEEGPFYLNDTLLRGDIAEDQPGIPLRLVFKVVDAACEPLPDTFVDVWTANSTGYYSGYTLSPGMGQNGSGGPPHGPHGPHGPHPPHPHHPPHPPHGHHDKHRPHHHPEQTDDLTFLRGIVQTDQDGNAKFSAIAPGWYAGRTPHIHLKVHVPYHTYTNETQEYLDSHVVHTSQLFFPDSLYDDLQDISPYKQSKIHRTKNHEDHDFNEDPEATLNIVKSNGWQNSGLTGSITVIVDPNATPKPVGPHMGFGEEPLPLTIGAHFGWAATMLRGWVSSLRTFI